MVVPAATGGKHAADRFSIASQGVVVLSLSRRRNGAISRSLRSLRCRTSDHTTPDRPPLPYSAPSSRPAIFSFTLPACMQAQLQLHSSCTVPRAARFTPRCSGAKLSPLPLDDITNTIEIIPLAARPLASAKVAVESIRKVRGRRPGQTKIQVAGQSGAWTLPKMMTCVLLANSRFAQIHWLTASSKSWPTCR